MKVTRKMQRRANIIMQLINEFCEDFDIEYFTTCHITNCKSITVQDATDIENGGFTNIILHKE